MADDWKVGDDALCVDDRPCPSWEWGGLVAGRCYRVEAIVCGDYSRLHGAAAIGLLMEGVAIPEGAKGWHPARFIKITPEEADDFDLETIELMNRKTVGETVA